MDLKEHLDWDDRIDASDIILKVKGNNLILSGNVPSYRAKHLAESIALEIKTINQVENNLEVKYPANMTIPQDFELKSNIEDLLYWNRSIDSSNIIVKVDVGVVTLVGTVPAFWQKKMVEDVISDLPGVLDFEDKLTIVPTESVKDQVISEKIMDAINHHYKINVNEIDIRVERGKVTISGRVIDRDSYNSLRNIADFTKGVISVEDNIIIESRTKQPTIQ
ncbi:MAG: Transport-associated protein [Promethearchaeota archaeon]|nr:MAG: Transport-associated protein [Candidatus Lokiarchaeota archaeon]